MEKELKALVFCSDKIPGPNNSTSGGGLRSFQLMHILHSIGIKVSFAVPEDSKYKCVLSEFKFLGTYNLENQASFIASHSYDIILWCNPGTVDKNLCRLSTGTMKCVDFHGPTNLECIHITGESLQEASKRIIENLRYVNFFSFVSTEQKNYWMGLFSGAGLNPDPINAAIVNLALPSREGLYHIGSKVRFAFVGGWHPWLIDEDLLIGIADVIGSEDNAELHFLGGAHKFCNEKYNSLVNSLKEKESVFFHGFLPHEEFLSFMNQSSCAVDLFGKSFERRLAISTRTVEFLNNQIPVIHPSWSPLAKILKKSGSGFIYEDKKDLFNIVRLITKCPQKLMVTSGNCRKVVQDNFNFEIARNSLKSELKKTFPRIKNQSRLLNYSKEMFPEKPPSILWVTFIPEGEPLRALRVETILYSLFKSGKIEGFGILSGNQVTIVGEIHEFDVVCFQREGSNNQILRDKIFEDKFLVDIDDLLFANASHRGEGYLRWRDLHFNETKELIEKCTLLSVTSDRLSSLISEYTGVECKKKSRVTPNCLVYPKSLNNSTVGNVEALIWTSSDFAALTQSKEEVTEACVSFCRDKKIPLFLFGEFSSDLADNFPKIRNFGMTNFLMHKQMLEEFSGKAIAVAPLETNANKETIDFIAGKSDLKMVEYGGFGIEAIYSKSPPYYESDLVNRYLAGNNFDEWRASLDLAYESPCIPMSKILEIREKRDASFISMQAWFPLFLECRRKKPIPLSEIESLLIFKSQKPLVKKAWSKIVPKIIRKKLDPYLQPIFG